ncbi:MAG: hypothetical protein V4590_04120 [Bacteroidota bacterium]
MRVYIILITILSTLCVSAQEKKIRPKGDKMINFQFHYTYMIPEGDLRSRFGPFHNIGFGGLFKTNTQWLFSLDASYQYGLNVKEEGLLLNLTNSHGVVMNNGGGPADYSVGQRGFSIYGKAGKLFPLSTSNLNSGVVVLVGGGVYYHKINFSTTRNDIPMLSEEYRKGYDRLSMGPALTQFVGYSYQSHNRYYNFFIGVDFMQAFTQSVRKFNYDTQKADTEQRLDMSYGFRVGWLIPIYLKSKNSDNEYEFK